MLVQRSGELCETVFFFKRITLPAPRSSTEYERLYVFSDETDPQRKEALRLRVNDYIKRAEELKRVYADDYVYSEEKSKIGAGAVNVAASKNPSKVLKKLASLDDLNFQELCLYS